MGDAPIWRRYLRLLGNDPGADVEDELEFHLAMRVEDLMRRGLSESDARAQARREFGDVEGVRQELEEIGHQRLERERRARWWDSLAQDLRFAGRTLRKSPGFTAVAVLTLAVGIGASAAMFTLVNSVLLRPLEYRDPARLVALWERSDEGEEENPTSPANFSSWREQARSFTDLAASFGGPTNLSGGEAEQVLARRTTANFFAVLGVDAQLGRTYLPGEDEAEVVVISHELWRRRFGGDPSAVGRSLEINGVPVSVIGVMPAGFHAMGIKPDVWRPFRPDPEWRGRFLHTVGRLRPGATLEQAQAEMRAIAQRMAAAQPEYNGGRGIDVVSVHDQVTGDVRPALLVLLGAVGLLLLIACANVANLLLGRAASRRREIAVRLSLGATRGRLIRQTLTESLLLAGLAGLLGLILAVAGTRMLVGMLPSDLALPRLNEVRVDGRVLGFALGTSLLTGILFGVAPALFGSTVRLAETLRDAMRGTTASRSGLRRGLVVAEVALAVVLLVGAGLLLRSLQRLMAVDTGVRAEGVLTARMTMSGPRYEEEQALRNFVGALVPRLQALPGAGAVGGIQYLPLTGEKMGHVFVRGDRPRPAEGEEPNTDIRVVAGDYFSAMGIPLRRGRAFEARDHENAPNVFVVNEELARQFFPGEDPVGKEIAIPWIDGDIRGEVVGVVGSVREMGPTEDPAPAVYRPFAQSPSPQMTMVVRSGGGDPIALAATVGAVVRDLDPSQPLAQLRTLEQVAADTVARPRFNLYLLGGFAAMALLLAGLGLYGIVSFSVTQRRHEIGVRVALGAQRGDVLRLILRQGLALTALGLLLGLAAAVASTRMIQSLLFGIGATDPVTLVGVAAFLAVVSLLASYLPGLRATRVDPMVAMRAE